MATITVQEAIVEYIKAVNRTHTAISIATYQQALRLFQHHLENNYSIKPHTPVSSINVAHTISFFQELQITKSIETEHVYSRALINFARFCEDNQWSSHLSKELGKFIEENRRPKQHVVRLPPLSAIEELLNYVVNATHAPDPSNNMRAYLRFYRDRAFILTLAETGLRISEIIKLRRNHYNLSNKAISPEPATRLPVSRSTTLALNRYLKERSPLDGNQHLFPQKDLPLFARHDKRSGGKVLPISRWTGANIINEWVSLGLSPATEQQLNETGQTITPHTFRHYFVITSLAQYGDVKHTQSLARHADPTTTRRYLRHAFPEEFDDK